MDMFFVDGTFEYCTKFFKQLFTLHSIKNGHYVQLVYALLPNKTMQSYKNFIDELLGICPTFKPKVIVVDFETAIHNAMKSEWSDEQVIGCRFHLCQAWYRQIQQLGLQSVYHKSVSEMGETVISERGKWLRYVFGLTFLDLDDVRDAINELISIQPQDAKLETFTEYILTNYVEDDAKFPPHLWAAHTSSLERTTNVCESFHSRFNNSFYHHHPDLFLFVHTLIEHQTDTYITIQTLDKPKLVRNTYAASKAHIDKLISEYDNDKLDLIQFMKRAGYRQCP